MLTSRQYRDANRHIEAAQEHLRLAAHYVQDDPQALARVASSGNNLRALANEIKETSVLADAPAKQTGC